MNINKKKVLTFAAAIAAGTIANAAGFGLYEASARGNALGGGLVGSTSGVSAGLAATDASLVPYGTMVATFYSGTGCLLCPSLLYAIVNLLF